VRAKTLLLVGWLLGSAWVWLVAADPRPIVGPGATREDVLSAYGWPTGQSQAGTKEILNYPQGQVVLENGKVERVAFNMNMPWPAPRPRPGHMKIEVKPENASEFWLTRFPAATAEASRRNARILALFTGSDWSPPSKAFVDEVAFHPDFIAAFMGDHVFLRLDYPTRAVLSPELKAQNTELRERYGVTTYPALLVLTPSGELAQAVDLTKPRIGETYRARVIAAVREVQQQLASQAAAAPAGARVNSVSAGPSGVMAAVRTPEQQREEMVLGLTSARWLVVLAVGAGLAFVVAAWWWLWRSRVHPASPPNSADLAERMADAGAGLPSASELVLWPREKLRVLASSLAEVEGFAVEALKDGDVDLKLRRPGEPRTRVLVLCLASGPKPQPASAKRVRELFGAMTVEGVETGWCLAPAGFAAEARDFAAQRGIVIFDATRLREQLRDLPPLVLAKVLGRVR
jgi:hypothetical protein